jgi:hypothetical protein
LNALFQLPDGSRVKRRFRAGAAVEEIFEFVESVGAGGFRPGRYRIVTRFPRRVLQGDGVGKATLSECGIGAGQEVFMLESLN